MAASIPPPPCYQGDMMIGRIIGDCQYMINPCSMLSVWRDRASYDQVIENTSRFVALCMAANQCLLFILPGDGSTVMRWRNDW